MTISTSFLWDPDAPPPKLPGKGLFTIHSNGRGWIIRVHRREDMWGPETILCASPGHANRVRQALTDEGLRGLVEGGL